MEHVQKTKHCFQKQKRILVLHITWNKKMNKHMQKINITKTKHQEIKSSKTWTNSIDSKNKFRQKILKEQKAGT